MSYIRRANKEDCVRIAEIEIFNYRLNFYPIFQNDWFYFDELQVPKQIRKYEDAIETIWVYDDGVVKGFIQTDHQEVKKLFVEPALQGHSIGSEVAAPCDQRTGCQILVGPGEKLKSNCVL